MPIRAAQVEPEYEYDYRDEGDYVPKYVDYNQGLDQDDVELTFATDMWAIAVERADGLERRTGKCFNCQEVGHYWRECPKPLKEDFKHLQDQPKRRQEELNGKGALERVAESPKMPMGSLRCRQRPRMPRAPNRRFTTPSLLER